MALIAWAIKGAAKNRYHADYYMPVDLVGHLLAPGRPDLDLPLPLLYLVP
jgi:hypothetical protein